MLCHYHQRYHRIRGKTSVGEPDPRESSRTYRICTEVRRQALVFHIRSRTFLCLPHRMNSSIPRFRQALVRRSPNRIYLCFRFFRRNRSNPEPQAAAEPVFAVPLRTDRRRSIRRHSEPFPFRKIRPLRPYRPRLRQRFSLRLSDRRQNVRQQQRNLWTLQFPPTR